MRITLLVLGILVAVPSSSAADEPSSPQPEMETYFEGEIDGGYTLIGMGLVGLVAGGLLYQHGTPVARGAMYPFLGIGLVHAAAGIFVALASEKRIDTFTGEIARDAPAFVERESQRMAGVSNTFTALKLAECVLIAGGLGTAAYAWRTDRPRLQGAGLALALEAVMTLGFDIAAARRAQRYRDALAHTRASASFDPASGATIATVSYTTRF